MTSGRTSFAEDLSPQGPIVAFDMALESVRDHKGVVTRDRRRGLLRCVVGRRCAEESDRIRRAAGDHDRLADERGSDASGR